jgi:hypothetical protein
MEQMMQSGQMGQMMGKKVGGRWTIGQYISYQKKFYMWLIIAAVIAAIGAVFGLIFLSWLVNLFGAFVFFWFGYMMAKERKGEMKDAIIGGAILGVIPGAIMGIGLFIYFAFLFSPLTIFGTAVGGYGIGLGIGQLIGWIIGGAVGGLVLSLIGYAVAGGMSKPKSA